MRITSNNRSFFSRVRGLLVSGAALAAIGVSVLAPVASDTVSAGPQSAPVRKEVTQFLSLPFEATESMNILSGWYYNGGGFHGGIDYLNGSPNGRGWKTFAVIASADGKACGNCTSRQGNAVWIEHTLNGRKYYTYYGHLASIDAGIPIGSQSRTVNVKRGQFLGWAGDTGSRGALHLHFALMDSGSGPIDPYSIGKLRNAYPAPRTNTPGVGWFVSALNPTQ